MYQKLTFVLFFIGFNLKLTFYEEKQLIGFFWESLIYR